MAEPQQSQHTTTADIGAVYVDSFTQISLSSERSSVVSDSDVEVHAVHLESDERLARCIQEIEDETDNPDRIVPVDEGEWDSADDAESVVSDNTGSNSASLMDILAIIGDVDNVEQFLAGQRELLRTFSRDHEEEDSDNEDFEGRRFWMRLLRSLSMPPEEQDSRISEECQVCLLEVRLNKRPCCEQAVCDDCLKQYVETQLVDAGIVRITCPNPSCDRGMYQEEVRELLREKTDLRDRYDRWIVDMNADPHRKTCPRCCTVTDVNPSQLRDRHVAKHGLKLKCSECQLEWCFRCQAPWHQGLTCKKFRTGDVLLKEWAQQKIRPQEYNAQRCPKCKIYIQRTEGCDHMMCTRCDTEFCYRCGGRRHKLKLFGFVLEDHDMKHSIIGCNEKYKPNEPVQRALARGGIFGAKVVGAVIAAPMVVGVAAIAFAVAVAIAAIAAPTYGSYKLARLIHERVNEDKFD